jgi:hypothetical protein
MQLLISILLILISTSISGHLHAQPPPQPLAASPADPASTAAKAAEVEFGHEIDPYYSNVSVSIPLTDKPIQEITGVNEFQVYKRLFANSLIPNFVLLEASAMPLPLLGVATKHYTPDFYRGFNIGSGNLNLLEAVTAGFQEPYAFTLFLGEMVSFVKPGEEKISLNKGYMGYMASYSNQHIKRNVLIPDHSVEAEWKLKGDRIFRDNKLSWSFRAGAKIHDHPEITNSYYLGFRRNNLDFNADFLSWLHNSDVNIRWDFSARNGRLMRQEYVFGKKIPLQRWKVALKIETGIILEDRATYSGALRDKDFQSIRAIIRPNLEF